MRTLKTIAAFLTFSLLITACIAQEKTEERKVSGFSGIEVSEGIKVELTYGDKELVEVTADEEYIDRVVTEVDGDELEIYIKGNNWNSWKKHILVKVTAKEINSIKAGSGSSLITQNLIESKELKLSSSSGASIRVAFKATNASCKSSSGANAKLKGSVSYLNADASSGAGIDASGLTCSIVNADASSGANIKVHVEEELEADASSGGSVKYSGNPKKVDVDKSSGGSVRKSN